jgi:hypothetical protein
MRATPKLIIGTLIITLAVIALLIYAYSQSYYYLAGPAIYVSYPPDGAVVYGPIIEIRGTAKRTSFLSLNDTQILIDPSGAFNEKLPLPSGYNIMKFAAKDRFGKQTEKLLGFMVTSTPKTN